MEGMEEGPSEASLKLRPEGGEGSQLKFWKRIDLSRQKELCDQALEARRSSVHFGI